MIEFQIREMVKATGLKSPYRTFRRLGMGHDAIRGYMTGTRAKINRDHLEILCTALRCTPDKLFAWTPSQPADDHPGHPLQHLRKKKLLNVDEALSKLTPEEIERGWGDEGLKLDG